ncbi:hypothetical protein K438DRAFT_13191 [Mycena galopus ATCC 62051]|nr:hypothetical protein K438DRAFT_13191 [Mycena galopus ATCC 62051]
MFNGLIDHQLTPSASDLQLRDVCDQLLGIMADTPEMQLQLVSSHGMLTILEVLEGKGSRDVSMRLLQIINLVQIFLLRRVFGNFKSNHFRRKWQTICFKCATISVG